MIYLVPSKLMRKTIILYSLILAALVFLLKFIEYHYWVRDLSLEFYIGLVAALFTAFGVWAGWKITQKKTPLVFHSAMEFRLDEEKLKQLGISKREHEVL